MKKLLPIVLMLITAARLSAQPAYALGDLMFNVNVGGPQITPALIKTGIKIWYATKWAGNKFNIEVKNSGVLNAKAEYAVHEDLGLGFASSYWNMGVNVDHVYGKNAQGQDMLDHYRYTMSALAIGVRGNYHFLTDDERKVIDPYYGITLGLTRYNYDVGFTSDDATRQLPIDTYQWRSGILTYISTTFGLRVYPVKFLAFNFEAGYDRGAFFFGGLVFKIHTKAPRFLRDR